MVGRTRTRPPTPPHSGAAVVIAGQVISAGAVSPIVIRAGHRAQVVVCGQHEMSRFVGGQLWMVSHQARGHLNTRGVLIPKFPANLVAVAQHRRIRSGDARSPYGGQEVRDGGRLRYRGSAGRRGQAYANDGSSGTDQAFSDHERLSAGLVFTMRFIVVHIMDT